MRQVKTLIGFALVAALSVSIPARAGGSGVNVNWGQNSINLSQLQNIAMQNPSASQIQVHFPNDAMMNVSPSQVQGYIQQAQQLGYKGIPDLSFSSLPSSLGQGNMSIEINQMSTQMEQAISNALHHGRYADMNIDTSWIPDWLKETCLTVWNWIGSFLDWTSSKMQSMMPGHR